VLLRAETALFSAAIALAVVALLVAPRRAIEAWRVPTAAVAAALGALAPLLLYPLLDPALAAGRALWEWSAAGGPTIQASYRLDGIGAVGTAVAVSFAAAGLFACARATASPRVLQALVLGIGFVFIAVAVTVDLVAAIVALGVLAALTAAAALLVAPAPSAMRLAAYFAVGIQLFVVAALLVARQGGPSLEFANVAPVAVSPGAVLAATVGAGLFAGLYPFVPWRYERAQAGAAEREPLRGLLAMPAGLAASLVLLRIVGMTRLDLATLTLPTLSADVRAGLVVALGVVLVVRVARRRRISRRAAVVTALATAILLAYPWIRWSQFVMVASLLTVLYAAAVSLALPEQWEVARHDVTLATLWVGFAIGTPVALAAALYVIAAAAASAIAESVWMPPHRSYIAIVIAAAQTVAGVLAMGIGAIAASDLVTSIGALTVLTVVLALELVQIARRLNLSEAPLLLDLTASLAAFGATSLLALAILVPVTDALAGPVGRPLGVIDIGAPAAFVVAVLATLLVIVARTVRPLLPDISPLASPLQRFVWAADPVPAGIGAFRALERAVTETSRGFALFERHAGVWLATVLIVALLVWSARP
jgi:hypothetical protein